jgi:hypothetical protein
VKACNLTLCLTIGRRPELLRQTLQSLLDKVEFADIIAINDFRDEETNQVFRELCPQGTLINLNEQVGHHKAVDIMYSQVKTQYIFHCEDDWFFDQPLYIDQYIQLLENDEKATALCLRKLNDFPHSLEEKEKIQFQETQPIATAILTNLHEQWYGYTFNPHITSLQLWKDIGGFSQFKKERHVSRYLRKKNMHNLFLKENICQHIGGEDSIANPPKTTFWAKFKGKIFG